MDLELLVLPEKTNNLTPLNLLDHKLIYKGKHSILLAYIGSFPSGNIMFGDVYSGFESSDTDSGNPQMEIERKKYSLRSIRSEKINGFVSTTLADMATDTTYLKGFHGTITMPYDYFVAEHFHDFIAHALAYGPSLETDSYLRYLKNVERFNPENTFFALGEANRVHFKTSKVDNYFRFSIEGTREFAYDDVVMIAANLAKYLRDLSIPFKAEPIVDDHGKKNIEEKKTEREFRQKHFSEIVECLKGDNNLANIIESLCNDSRYELQRASNQQCVTCGRHYTYGIFSRIDLNEGWLEGIWGHDLHALSAHPETYIQRTQSLQKIYRMLKEERKGEPTPALSENFMADTEAVKLFNEFSSAFDIYSKAYNHSYKFWWDTHGGIHPTKRQLAKEPKLRSLLDEQNALQKVKDETFADTMQLARRLTQKLYSIDGIVRSFNGNNEPELNDEFNFWAKQANTVRNVVITSPQMALPYSKKASG